MELTFEKEAIEAIADKTIERKIGARGLRSIIENSMLDIMFELPSDKNAVSCVMTKESIDASERPRITYRDGSVEPSDDSSDTGKRGRKNKIEETA